MKSLLAAAATAALLACAGGASAQMYPQPMTPPPGQMYGASMPQPAMQQQPMQQPAMQQPTAISGVPSWMQDDGSSSDYPIHNPGDVSGQWLNSRYQGGLTVPPGAGLPAQWDQQ
jgi:hypothetical protein